MKKTKLHGFSDMISLPTRVSAEPLLMDRVRWAASSVRVAYSAALKQQDLLESVNQAAGLNFSL